jgi:hypothetical protein
MLGFPAQGRAAVTRRIRNAVWRELPFSARRALIGAVRTLDRWEDRVHRCWRSLIDSLDDSPAWLFVAIVGTIGVILTILLFFSLTREALAARSTGGLSVRVIEPAEIPVHATNELDSRLCLETPPLKPLPYPAEFNFTGGALLADEPVRRPPRTRSQPAPVEEMPPWDEVPAPPRKPRETRTVTSRPEVTVPEFDTGRPDLIVDVDWDRERRHLAMERDEPTEVSARSADVDAESRPRLAVLGGADRDGWSWFRERFGSLKTPRAYSGEAIPVANALPEDLSELDATTIASRVDVALQLELYAPEHATLQQAGRSHIVVRNAGDDTIRRLELREETQPLELITAAEPAASLTDGVLSRELRNLRRGRERTLGLEWFPQSSGRRTVAAQVLGEAVVAALVQVEREPEPSPEPEPARVREEPPPLPRRSPPPVVEPVPEPEPMAEPEPAPQSIIRRPPRKPTRVTTKPGLECQVKNDAQVAVRAMTELQFAVRNTGDTDLQDVRIWVTLPATLAHRQGSRLEHTIGDLAAGQSYTARLRVVGAQPGPAQARVQALAADDVTSEATATLQVIAPAAPERPRLPVQPACPCGPLVSSR